MQRPVRRMAQTAALARWAAMDMPAPPSPAAAAALASPQIRLAGAVDDAMLQAFRAGLAQAESGPDPIVVELTTLGGDADVGRAIGIDVEAFRERTGRAPLFLGKAVVYSAGVSIMAGFRREDRWLQRAAMLMIHGRRLSETLALNGPLAAERQKVAALLNEIDVGLALERRGFERLVAGTGVTLDELYEKIGPNWYLTAEDALARGLVGGLL